MSNIDRRFEDSLHLRTPRWYHVKPWDRHGLVLMTAGFSYILIGAAFVFSEDSPTRLAMFHSVYRGLPYSWWCVGFMVVGAISVISSRWPSKPRTLGYATLTGWTAGCSGLYVFGGLFTGSTGYLVTGFMWAVMGFLWWAISGLFCPPDERGSRGVSSPHSDGVSDSDRDTSGIRHTKIGFESEPNSSYRILES